MKLTKQKQQHLVLVGMLTLTVCGGVWFGLIQPQDRRLTGMAAKLEQALGTQSNVRKVINMREVIAADLQDNGRKLAAIEGTFADGDLYSWFIIKLREFQLSYGVETPQISREVVGDMNLLPEYPYRQASYSIRGSAYFEELGRFISDFENRFPYCRLLNLEVEADAGASPDGEKLGFRLDVSTLIKPAQTPAD